MGYYYSGRCQPDSASVLDSFKLTFPQVDASGIATLASASVSGATPPVLSFSVVSTPWNSLSSSTKTSSFTLQTCTLSTDLQLLPGYSTYLLVAACLLFGLGFLGSR